SLCYLCASMSSLPPRPPRLPYTTLFRSRRMAEAARKPVHFDGQSLEITVSIGLALQNADATAESLIRDADVALYRAKESGRNQVDRKSTRLNSSHVSISYAVFCLKKKTT